MSNKPENKSASKKSSPNQIKAQKKDSFADQKNFQDGSSIWFRYPLFWIPFTCGFSIVAWILATKEDASIFSASSIFQHWPSLTFRGVSTVLAYLLIELILLVIVPGEKVQGPFSPSGYRPTYRANGVQCYFIINILLIVLNYFEIISFSYIFDILGEILLACNIGALFLCLGLYFKGKYFPSSEDVSVTPGFKNFSNEYFWGTELHPSIFGVEIKQLINCRFGMMGWQILLFIYVAKQYSTYGYVSNGMIVSVLLQTCYIFKFFTWEVGYFHTIDIAHDKLGFYICWGCCVWVPVIYTITGMYLTLHPLDLSFMYSLIVSILGLVFLYLNYETDIQKQNTRKHNGNNLIWGRKPKVMRVKYLSTDGLERENLLLIDGYWAYARHSNYTFELILAFLWCLPAGFFHFISWVYFFHLVGLLIDRTHRDNTRCTIKYGNAWKEYCKVVKYNLIPGVF
eukprot:TRINITY_DN8988_c0_g1_i1.p1 TRINITY_DN8988_c0_g1~~TRINITY_DN8988_c0_g1_i1.p1  ORF type:complete len:455 (-),score=76.07 TRINITY_DN8988_c0_g1_i1:9-1373(-)